MDMDACYNLVNHANSSRCSSLSLHVFGANWIGVWLALDITKDINTASARINRENAL